MQAGEECAVSLRTTCGLACVTVLPLLAACGGGGTKSEPLPVVTYADSTLSGTYTVFTFSGTETTPLEVGTGTAVSDAQGHLDATLTTNRDGVVAGPTAISLLYEVAADGSLSVRDAVDPDLFFGYGGVSSDGAFGVYATMGEGDQPAITLLMRHGAGYSTASVDAKQNALGFGAILGSNDVFLVRGPTASDGEGGISPRTLPGIRTYAGQQFFTNTHHLDFGGHFSTAADGASTLRTASEDFSGALVLGGLTAGWAGALGAGQTPSVYFVTKQVPASTNALFVGGYWHVALIRLRHGGFRAYTGPIWSDGSESVTLTQTTNSDGEVAHYPSWNTPYAVWDEGTFGIHHVCSGFITADGRFVAAHYGAYPSLGEGLSFFIRK
jgi:hypothetical protein